MTVFEDRKEGHVAVEAAGGDDRDLALEIDEGLEDTRHPSKRLPGLCRVRYLIRRNLLLSFPVVSERGRLQHGGGSDGGEGRCELLARPHHGPRRDGDIHLLKKLFFSFSILRNKKSFRPGPNGNEGFERIERGARHVFELERQDVE